MQAGNAVVTLDRFSAFGTFPVTITFDPVMEHRLCRLFALDVSGYTGRRRSLHTSFVHRVLANWYFRERKNKRFSFKRCF